MVDSFWTKEESNAINKLRQELNWADEVRRGFNVGPNVEAWSAFDLMIKRMHEMKDQINGR